MASKGKSAKRVRKKKGFTIKALDEQRQLGFIEMLYSNGDYGELLTFLLETLDSTIVRINYGKGCIELYVNEENTEQKEIADNLETLTQFEQRIKRINHTLTEKQQKVLRTYKELNYDDPYQDLEDEDE